MALTREQVEAQIRQALTAGGVTGSTLYRVAFQYSSEGGGYNPLRAQSVDEYVREQADKVMREIGRNPAEADRRVQQVVSRANNAARQNQSATQWAQSNNVSLTSAYGAGGGSLYDNAGVGTPTGTGAVAGGGTSTGGTGGPAATSGGALTTAQQSAKAVLEATLSQYGLASLAGQLWQRMLTGAPMEQLMLEIRDTPEYKTRFPAMEALRKKGRAISEAEYINYEKRAGEFMRQAGLPAGFYDDPSDFGKFLANDISISELQQRVQMAGDAAYQVPDDVRQQFQSLYGIGAGDLTAFFLDPDKAEPLLIRRFESAKIGGAATRTGFGQLQQAQAEQLQALGVTEQQAQQGLGELARSRELFSALPGQEQGEDTINTDLQLGAAFAGNNDAQNRIEAQRRRRQATFAESGGFATGREGFALGKA